MLEESIVNQHCLEVFFPVCDLTRVLLSVLIFDNLMC